MRLTKNNDIIQDYIEDKKINKLLEQYVKSLDV